MPPFILKLTNNKFSSPSIIYAGGSWASVSGIKSLSINSWYYFIVTYVPGYIKTYINGELDASVVKTGSLAGGGKLIIGGWSSGSALPDREFFKGLIDDVRIYDKALSLSEIKQEYVAGLDSLYSKGLISKEEYNKKIESLAFEGS
ncbi:MAG: LamG domain-containing protein [Candidatus Pacebacteria bacterium]|nr:LamG domain-containing protein [Candidatus Paceibacterota bacterium]